MKDVHIEEPDRRRIEAVWATVFRASNKLIRDAKHYGFEHVGEQSSPNVEEMVGVLRMCGAVIDLLMTPDLPYEQSRQLLNARSQITVFERVAISLQAGRKSDFEDALRELEKQAVL